MSYDCFIKVDTGGDETLQEWIGNYTSNVSPIWARCLTAVVEDHPALINLRGQDDRGWLARQLSSANPRPVTVRPDRMCLRDLADARMGDIAPLLADAVQWGREHIEELRLLNPANGWGDADTAVEYMAAIADAAEQHPRATLGISS